MKFDVGVRHVVTVRQAIQYSNSATLIPSFIVPAES